MRKSWIGIACILILIIIGFGLHINLPKKINKEYTLYIYSNEGKLLDEVPAKLIGKKYLKTDAYRDYFDGVIEVEGKTIEIISTKERNASADYDMDRFYGAGNVGRDTGAKGEVSYSAFIIISKDFKTVHGYVPSVINKYGGGTYFKSDKNLITPQDEYAQYKADEPKRIALYIESLRGAFKIGNGGNGFIAIKTDTLTGINNEVARQEVLNGFKDLSENVYEYESIKDDTTKFKYENGHMVSTVNGTILFVEYEEYRGSEATIKVTSWYGNLGANTTIYNATYKEGRWHLRMIVEETA